MSYHHLIRYSEIALKGKNRGVFEKQLIRNLSAICEHFGDNVEITRIRGRLIIKAENRLDYLACVFGVQSVSAAVCVAPVFDDISDAVRKFLKGRRFSSFRVTTRRLDKDVDFTSHEMDCMIGDLVVREYGKKVMLKAWDVNIGIEVINSRAYVFTDRIMGFGGLPVGSSGDVLVRTGEGDHELAAWLMMKRGCTVMFDKAPKTSYLEVFNMFRKFETGMEADAAKAVVLGCDAESFVRAYDEHPGVLLLAPLVGFSREMTKDIKDRIGSCCRKFMTR